MDQMHRLLLAFAACLACAQTAEQRPEFDVASLKAVVLDGQDTYTANLGTLKNGVLAMTNVTLADLLRSAYGIPTEDQIAGPSWIKSKSVRFDVQAKTSPATARDAAFHMLQPLLEQRFQMTFHHEEREMSYLAMTQVKSGAKLQTAKEPPDGPTGTRNGRQIQHNHIDMPMLAYLISRFTRTRVLDMTGLKGYFEVDLRWSPDDAPADDPVGGLPIREAIQKQLGLRLDARKGPVDTLVVDKVNQVPLEN